MAHAGTSDDGVWRRLYLAVLSWILVGFGVLAWLGVSPGGLLSGRWSLLPVGLGLGGLLAAAVGPVTARVALGAIGGLLVLAGLGWIGLLATLSTLGSSETVSAVAITGTGVSCLSLTASWPRRESEAHRSPAERWWQTRWWLILVVTGFPFAFGISASLLAIVGAPSTPGCGESAERALVVGANALAARVGGLHLGELGGCDSGDAAAIEWEHSSLNDLLASARTAGCRDAYPEDWDEEYRYMVCGKGPTRLVLTIEPDPGESGATGSISLDS